MNDTEQKSFEIVDRDQGKYRNWVKVYDDFLNCPLLTGDEKLMFITLKSFVNYSHGDETGFNRESAFPSIDTLSRMTGQSEKTVRRILISLEDKGAIERKRRGLTKSNLYILSDRPEMWQAADTEELRLYARETEEERAERILRRAGKLPAPPAGPSKKAASNSEEEKNAATKQTAARSRSAHSKTKSASSAPLITAEAYPMLYLRQSLSYNWMVKTYPDDLEYIDICMQIIYDTVNTQKPTVRVSGEEKDASIVASAFLKLKPDMIMYSINQFRKTTQRITHQKAYLTTLLYATATGQFTMDVDNQVYHDLYGSEEADN